MEIGGYDMAIKFYDSPFHVTHPDSVASILASSVDQATRKQLITDICKNIACGDMLNAEKLLKVYNEYWRAN